MSGPLRVLSLGGGWQSSCLLLMSCAGDLPKLDAAIFADTQHEMPETYDYIAMLGETAAVAGIPLLTVTAGDLKADIISRTGLGNQPSIPVMLRHRDGTTGRVNGYHCSFNYKREVVTREVKRLCGGRGAWKTATVEQWIGYSVDEASRMKQPTECRCGHNRARAKTSRHPFDQIHGADGCSRCGCSGFDPWQVNRWPLIEMRMRRGETGRWFEAHGFPTPPRSACYFCPNRGNSHWRDLRQNRPLLWASAVELDRHVRRDMNGLTAEAYLHQSAVPLADADLRPRYEQLADEGIDPLFNDEVDMDCDAGTCFT